MSKFSEKLDEQQPPLLTEADKNERPSLRPLSGDTMNINTGSSTSSAPTAVPSPMPEAGLTTSVMSDGEHVITDEKHSSPTPPPQGLKPAPTMTWGLPVGLKIRSDHQQELRIFRVALGINSSHLFSSNLEMDSDYNTHEHKAISTAAKVSDLESGVRGLLKVNRVPRAVRGGVYDAVIRERKWKAVCHTSLDILLYVCYFTQIVVGASLTALGTMAGSGSSYYAVVITTLGVVNTVIAGVLALVKGQGLPEKLRKDEIEFRKLQDWIEETEALIAVGVTGKDRIHIGHLVEHAFRKYNAAKASVENNRPDAYVSQGVDPLKKP